MNLIKFRAWDPTNKCFYTLSINRVGLKTNNTDRKNLNRENLIFQQYIGIHDKNDKEIYEGDIVRFYDRANQIEIIGVVRYNKACQYVVDHVFTEAENKWKAGKKKNFAINNNCEVIGNDKENMDLLK